MYCRTPCRARTGLVAFRSKRVREMIKGRYHSLDDPRVGYPKAVALRPQLCGSRHLIQWKSMTWGPASTHSYSFENVLRGRVPEHYVDRSNRISSSPRESFAQSLD